MLERLTIKNIALIKDQTIEFGSGLNVLTGETGAGKSLIIDSLSLLLGEKADKSLISYGESAASVEAVFTNLSQEVKEIMLDLGLESEDSLIIMRKLNNEGKNECRVNGCSFTLSMLKKLSAPLMDLHGQFEHQNLLKVSSHLTILDLFGGKEILNFKSEYLKALNDYKQVISELSSFTIDDVERNRLIDLYGYQIEEIDNANFYEGEEEDLKEYRKQVLNQEKIQEALGSAINLSYGDGYESVGLNELVKKVIVKLNSIVPYFDKVSPIIERLESLKLELEDVVCGIEDCQSLLVFDEAKAKENEARLDLLSDFKKKYGYDISEINEYRRKIGIEYEKLTNSYDRISQLKELKQKYEEILIQKATVLTNKRKCVAKEFERNVTKELKDLGMKNANFKVDFKLLDLNNVSVSGFDKVEFMFSANLGEMLKPLKAVASGGEMSRFMLAVKNITAKIENIATLIFDEVDTGVSGQNALILAEKLGSVGKMAQVICVTHLAQIASFGNNHYFIEKYDKDNKTQTSVRCLVEEERVKEIARLISGNITESALFHANEMLTLGKDFYKK